jgi:protein phosphatase
MLRASGVSDTGRVRPINEDSYICDESLGLFVVADGMGGHSAGEVASRLAIESVDDFMRRGQEAGDDWPYGYDQALSVDGNRLRTAVCLANRRVVSVAESHDDYTGMGTTIVAALIAGPLLVVGHVGDSRLYSYANGQLSRATRDDSWVETILAMQQPVSLEVLATHPMRNVLTNVLGAREPAEVHISERMLEPDEVILLCSDGVHGVLNDAQIAAVIASHAEPADVAYALVQAALEGGSHDNVTAVVARVIQE